MRIRLFKQLLSRNRATRADVLQRVTSVHVTRRRFICLLHDFFLRCCKKNGFREHCYEKSCRVTAAEQRSERKGGKLAGNLNVHTAMEEYLFSLAAETA